MPRVASVIAACLSAVSLGAGAQDPRPRPQTTGPPDPAIDVVAARLFVTTIAAGVDVRIDHATIANAIFTQRAGPSSLRTSTVDNTIRISANTAGTTATIQVDAILTDVKADSVVLWSVTLASTGGVQIEVANQNHGAPTTVDRFDTSDLSARFSTKADLLRSGGPLPAPGAVDRLVLAFFYPWYDRNSWSSPQLLDRPLEPYSTDDQVDMRRVARQAADAALDALVVSWMGKTFDGGWNHRRMLMCLDAARDAGLRIATLLETTVANPQHEQTGVPPDPDTVFAWLVDIVDSYGAHPAYLRVDNRPVVFAYAAQRLTLSQWTEVLSRLRASGRDVLVVGEGANSTRLGAFDGLFFYASNLFGASDIPAFDRAQSLSARTYYLLPDQGARRLWVATVSPGYDDTQLTDGRAARVTDRDGGRYFDVQWRSALDMRADWVVVTSWNEWWENTEIEPSQRYGDFYLRSTRSWASRFRDGSPDRSISHAR
jgi:hypothetical protein